MGTFLVVVGTLLLFLGFPISVIFLIVKAIKRRPLKNVLVSIAFCFFGSILIIGIGGSMLPDSESEKLESELKEEQGEDTIQEQKVVESPKKEVVEEDDSQKKAKEKAAKEKAEAEKKAQEQAKKEEAERKAKEKKEQEKKEQEEKANTFKYADVKMKYLKSEINYNSLDEKCLYVYFEMTNNSDENQAFDYLVSCKAFQNGIEIDENYIYDCEEEENGSKEIQPGATITVAEVFEIGDSTESVTLEVRPFNIWSDKLLFEKEIQITE